MSEIEQEEPSSVYRHHLPLAIFCISIAAFIYTLSSIFVKLASAHAPTNFIVFFRYGFFLIFLLPVALAQPKRFKSRVGHIHAIRGICGALAIGCFYYAVHYVPLTQAVLLSVSTPLFIPIVLRLTRHISIIPHLYWGMGIGLVGIALILHPSATSFHIALFIALLSAIFRAFSSSFVRRLSKEDANFTILFYYFLAGTVLSGITLFISPPKLSNMPWLLLLGVGITSAFYQVFLTLAYKWASARLVSPFSYLAVVFAALADWLIWQQSLSISAIIGILLVFFGATLTVLLGGKRIKPKA